MSLILLILVILIAFIACSWFLWPIKTLKVLMQYSERQRYKPNYFHTNYVTSLSPVIVISNAINLFVALLLRKVSKQKITMVSKEQYKLNRVTQALLDKVGIVLMDENNIQDWDKAGVLLIHENRYELASSLCEPIIPMQVCGTEAIKYEKGKNIPQWLHMSFFEPLNAEVSPAELKEHLEIRNIYAWERYVSLMPSISEIWIEQAKARGNKRVIADSTGIELSSHKLLTATLALSNIMKPHLLDQERVGICMPPSVGGTMAMMCVLMQGKTMVNLNYTASQSALDAAINSANIKTIITSGRFIEQLKKKGFDVEEVFSQCDILLLEDLRQQVDKFTLFMKLLEVKLFSAQYLIQKYVVPVSISHAAAILFSSGSEGKPKGVVLSHKNLVANAKQSMIIMGAKSDDSVLSILPIFHAMGLTATTFLPLLEGVFMVCHPDPTDAQILAKISTKYKPTILVGTSTFFRIYAKNRQLPAEAFASLKYVVAGAERLSPEVRAMFEKKFNKPIYEGYGTTELSPVACVNQPDEPNQIRNKLGTVGCSLPGGRFMITDPETLEELPIGEAGMITYGGVNVMQGYLNDSDKTHEVLFVRNRIRWYQTGDKGKLDEDGYLTILDRYSRFAKLGGEMVSLTSVEDAIINELQLDDEQSEILAVATPDLKKGEQITLLYTMDADPDELRKQINASSMNNLQKPQNYFKVDGIPKLGSGKTDFTAAKKLCLKLLA